MDINTILLILLILGVATAAIWIIYKKGKTEEFPTHNVKVVCHMRQFSNNYHEGWFVKRIVGKTRSIIIFQPTDIDFNKPQLVKNQRVVVKNSILETFSSAKGIESNEIGYMYLYPHKADLFSKHDQKVLGKEFLEKIEKIGETDDMIEIMRNREKIQKDLLMKTEGWSMVKDWVKDNELMTKDLIKNVKNLRDDKKPFTNPGGNTGGFN